MSDAFGVDASPRSEGLPTRSSTQQAVEELPDLTDRIMTMGLYDEYKKFRDGNLIWRGGGHRGARGELNAEALDESPERQHRSFLASFYPSFESWHWRRTASYWIAISFLEGSLLFLFGSGFGFATDSGWRVSGDHHVDLRLNKALSIWPSLFGGVFFSFGAYLMCLESMNILRNGRDSWKTNLLNVPAVLEYLESCNRQNSEVTRIPYLASMCYFVGTSIYPVALVANLWTHLDPTKNLLFSTIPYTFGGAFFIVGGFLECVENKVFTTGPSEGSLIPKCAAAMNFVGGILFTIAGAVLFFPHMSAESNLCYMVGSLLYTISSSLSVILWKDEQFGLAYLAALNHMHGQDRSRSFLAGQQSAAFSVRGIFFIHLYCVVSVVAVMNFCLALNHFLSSPNLFTLTRAGNEFLPFVLLHLVLLMHSAVVKTPKTQPFHALVISLRCTTVVIMLLALGTFIAGLMHPPPPPLLERHSLRWHFRARPLII